MSPDTYIFSPLNALIIRNAGGITDEASKKTEETAAKASQKANQAQKKDETLERGNSY